MKNVMLMGRLCMFAVGYISEPPIRHLPAMPGWYGSKYSYVLISQDVRDALQGVRAQPLDSGAPVRIKIRGQVRGEIRAETAGGFLDKVTQGNGLIWYFDGSVLHVNASDEFATQIINIGRANGQSVIDEIKRLDLMDERFSVLATANAPAHSRLRSACHSSPW